MSKLQEVQRVSKIKTVWLVILAVGWVATICICMGVIVPMSDTQTKYDYLLDNACDMKYGKNTTGDYVKLKEICVNDTTPYVKSLDVAGFKKHIDDVVKNADTFNKYEQSKKNLESIRNVVNGTTDSIKNSK